MISVRSKKEFYSQNKRRMLDILGVDILPKVAALLDFMRLALELGLEDFRVVGLFVVVDV